MQIEGTQTETAVCKLMSLRSFACVFSLLQTQIQLYQDTEIKKKKREKIKNQLKKLI